MGIAGLYPRFSARTGAVQDLADRVNDCMERSMNGRPLPRDGREMAALLAYLDFLGSLQPRGEPLVGRGAPRLPLPTRAASPQRGERVYRDMCAACHRPDGAGVRLSPADRMIERRRYVFPPLWGPESYNDAAGMSRIVTGAWFARANMPNGIRYQYPLLAVDDAYDVMAYVDTRPRPHKPNLDRDYPDPWTKPVGTMFPPWPGHFSAERNRFGPWQAILDWRDRHRPRLDGTQSPSLSPQPATVLGHGLD
ncbi:MAG: c-type cytochrome [Acetobacteraceae bacterium]